MANERVVIVTGAGSAIGRGIAVELARRGYRLSIHGRDASDLGRTKELCIGAGSQVEKIVLVTGDIGSEDVCKELVNGTIARFGSIYGLVNAASLCLAQDTIHDDDVLNNLEKTMRVNLRSPIYLTHLTYKELEKAKGAVVNISSLATLLPTGTSLTYEMSKAGLDYFTRVLANHMGRRGIRAYGVNAGFIDTPKYKETMTKDPEQYEKMRSTMLSMQPISRAGDVKDVSKLVAFFLSDDATFITGVNIPVDGGAHDPIRGDPEAAKEMFDKFV